MGSLCLQALWCDCSVFSEVMNTVFPLSLSYIHTLTSPLSLFQHQTNKAKQFHPQFPIFPGSSLSNSICKDFHHSLKESEQPSVCRLPILSSSESLHIPPLTFTLSLHLSHTDSWDSPTVFVCVWAHARKARSSNSRKRSRSPLLFL